MGQCKSVTDDDKTRCKRQALPGRRYCWQHESSLFRGITVAGVGALVLTIIGLTADLTGLGILPQLISRTFTPAPANAPSSTPTPKGAIRIAQVLTAYYPDYTRLEITSQ
jgi:hypothetical protein